MAAHVPADKIAFVAEGPYTPVYDRDSKENFASVNAGDFALYVGGGGINLAFGKCFDQTGISNDELETLHHRAFNQASVKAGSVVKVDTTGSSQVECCYAVSNKGHDEAPRTAGFACIDIFKKGCRPLGSDTNLAMVYVVGPSGSKVKDVDRFRQLVRLTGENTLRVTNQYNADNANSKIEVLRVALVSGGVYKHKQLQLRDVAAELMTGIAVGFDPLVSPTIEYAYAEGAFLDASKQRN